MSQFPAVQPHGPLEELTDGIYWVQGTMRLGPGTRINRNMVVVRTGSELTLISPVRLSPKGEEALERLGQVKHVVKIGALHSLDDAYCIWRFGARYWALPGAEPCEIPVHEVLRDDHLPVEDAQLFVFVATNEPEGALILNREGGVLITCDSVQNWPDTQRCSLPAKWAVRAMGLTKRPAQIGPPWRSRMTPKQGSLEPDFQRLVERDFKHLIGGHGAPLMDTAKDALEATVAATFKK